MNTYFWHPGATESGVLPENSFLSTSRELTNWSLQTGHAPNAEQFLIDILEDRYDIFDYSKDVIDVGACMGVYAINLVKEKFNHAYAFEANKDSVALIYMNALSNGVLDKIDIFNTFVSDGEGVINYNGWMQETYGIDCNNLTARCFETMYMGDKKFNYSSMETHALDEYNFTNIGFIKIDVEGQELEVLKGAVKTIVNNNYPPILFEMWPEDEEWITDKEAQKKRNEELINGLTFLGYTITYNVNEYRGTHLAVKY